MKMVEKTNTHRRGAIIIRMKDSLVWTRATKTKATQNWFRTQTKNRLSVSIANFQRANALLATFDQKLPLRWAKLAFED